MTGLVEYQGDNKLTHHEFVRDGIQGNMDVLWRMIDLVRDTTLKDKGFEDFIKQLLASHKINSYSDTEKTFQFLFDFVKDNIDYLQDIAGKTESIKDARTTLEDKWGDCDDFAILNASILSVLGYEPFFVIGKYPESDSYQHVYTCVYVSGKRYVFDQTLPEPSFNKEVTGMDTKEFAVFGEYEETDGIKGALRSVKTLFQQTLHNVKDAAPFLASFAPFGFVGNSLLRTAFGSIAADSISLNELGSQLSGRITDITIRLQNGLMTQDVASKQAHEIYSKLFAYGDTSDDTFNAIESKLKTKVAYIDNYGFAPTFLSANSQMLTYLGYGVLVLGVLYFFNKKD